MNISTPYVCNNKPRPVANHMIKVQDGWGLIYIGAGQQEVRVPRMTYVPFAMVVDCQYDRDDKDPRCTGCVHGQHLLNTYRGGTP